MKFACLGALAVSLIAAAARAEAPCVGTPAGARLVVQVVGAKPVQGKVVVTVYPDDAKRFLAPHGKLLRARAPAEAPTTRACFELPGPGTYAVAVYHDANGDGHFNRSLIGLPQEGFGFSNDAPTKVGLPAFSAVRLPVKAGETVTRVILRYVHRGAST